jgi:D-alanyl-lipoteichoic acid acyltransferase DltB (MBOAT superfamily)
MLFYTWLFLAFFAIVYPLYLLVQGTRLRLVCLLVSSYVFYAALSPLYLIPIIYHSLADHLLVARMVRSSRKKLWLSLSIANSLALLIAFKYSSFLVANLNALLAASRIPYALAAPSVLLPAGLSFYLFQSMGYVIDCYWGRVERETSFLAHATYVTFFPRLLAGPIERAGNLFRQLRQNRRVTVQDFSEGLSLFVVGLFKKAACADYLALYVNKVYAAPGQFESPALILATFLFAWQIYFDFSGYTDMARGIAQMMGIRLMLNFNSPYLAASLGEFWNRWHISLSSWFKDYVYIPLGGNRKGAFNTYRNMFLAMVLSGLWHGAAWTFVLWGVVHALGRFATREMERTSLYRDRIPKLAKQAFVFAIVTFAWVFFRAESIGDAWTILTRIFTSGWTNPYCPVLALVLIAIAWCYQFAFESRWQWVLQTKLFRIGAIVLMLTYLAVFRPAAEQAFIYMQF